MYVEAQMPTPGQVQAHAAQNAVIPSVPLYAAQQHAVAAPARDKPMLDVEYDQLVQATVELDQSVRWLLQRIQPICQPSTEGKAIEGTCGATPDAPTSELRTKLKSVRGLIESISGRIADVRYTIEV